MDLSLIQIKVIGQHAYAEDMLRQTDKSNICQNGLYSKYNSQAAIKKS